MPSHIIPYPSRKRLVDEKGQRKMARLLQPNRKSTAPHIALESLFTSVMSRRASRNAQPWGGWAITAGDSQPWTEIWGYSEHKLTKTRQLKFTWYSTSTFQLTRDTDVPVNVAKECINMHILKSLLVWMKPCLIGLCRCCHGFVEQAPIKF